MTDPAHYSTVTIHAINTKMADNLNSFADQVKKSSYQRGRVRRYGSGANLSTQADSKASTARCSATNPRIKRVSLSDRLTQSLITAGLVNGIIPISMRSASGQQTLDAVLRWPDGKSAEPQKGDC